MDDPRIQTFTIDEDESESNAFDLGYHHLCALRIPALTGTIVKLLVKESETENGTYDLVYERDGTLMSFACDAVAARRVQCEPGLFAGLRWVKLVAADADDVAEAVTGADFDIDPAIRWFG